MNPLKRIFGRKVQKNIDPQPKPEIRIEAEKKEETFVPKSIKKVTRGADGKFVSKTPSAKKTTQVKKVVAKTETVPQKKVATSQAMPNYQILTFYGKSIRKTYQNNSWYFPLEDILPVAAIDSPNIFLKELQEKEFVKSTLESVIAQIKFLDENGVKTVNCVNYEGFMTLLPIIRDSGHIFLGPFPDWIRGISKLA